jgi:sulfite exporter TauE/SafE
MLFSALLLGLLGSFHCIGMCGPIAFLLPVDRSNNLNKFVQIFLYHFGRIVAYSLIGLIFGLLGKSFYLFGMQQQLSIGIGLIMIISVLIPLNRLNSFNFSKPIFKLISFVKTALGEALKKKSADTFLTIGFLNGFLPCGLVYMAVFGAIASGTALEGGMYMVLFGLGTIPLMTSAIYVGNILSGKVRQYIRRSIPVFVVIIGCLFVLRGMGLGIMYISPKPVVESVDAKYECQPNDYDKNIL